jgi:hypothetical protein
VRGINVVRAELNWENVRRFLLGKNLSGIVRDCPAPASHHLPVMRPLYAGRSAKSTCTNTSAFTKKSSGENSQNRLGNRPVRRPLQ